MKKETKQSKLINLCLEKFVSEEEMIKITGLAKTSIKMYINYYFKKIGYKLLKEINNNIILYKIEKEDL
jgi:hypothetical protein